MNMQNHIASDSDNIGRAIGEICRKARIENLKNLLLDLAVAKKDATAEYAEAVSRLENIWHDDKAAMHFYSQLERIANGQ